MKKIKLIVVAALVVSVLASCGKNESSNSKGNYFNGSGQIKSAIYLNGNGMLYDENNIYMKSMLYDENCYLKFTSDNKLYINCDVATCTHKSGSCTAMTDKSYFIFNDVLYSYSNNLVIDAKSGDTKFTNTIPEECDDLDASKKICKIEVLNNEYFVVLSNRCGYVLDSEFNITYTYTDLGKWTWGKIYNNIFYYVNDIEELISVNLETGEKNVVEISGKIYNADDDEEWIFFSDTDRNLYKYSLQTKECTKIHEKVAAFTVINGYIYYQETAFGGDGKYILDYDGNIVKDCTECEYMDMDTICEINGRIYSEYYDIESKLPAITVMNVDGSDYAIYYIEGYESYSITDEEF